MMLAGSGSDFSQTINDSLQYPWRKQREVGERPRERREREGGREEKEGERKEITHFM